MRVTDKKVIWEGSFVRTMLLTYTDRKGKERTWEAVERVNCRGIAVIAPVTEQGEVLLVRQFRPVLNKFIVEFPAGLNDRGESISEAALRELVEETGYSCDELIFLAEGPVSSGLSTEVLTAFLAKNAFPAPPELKRRYPPDESEDIEIIKVPIAEVHKILEEHAKRGDSVDLKVYGLLELATGKLRAGRQPDK